MPWKDPIMCDVHFENIEHLENLLRRGHSPEGKRNSSISPLTLAVQSEKSDICRLLIKHGASVNKKGEYGQTPIFDCLGRENSFDIFELLLQSGAKVDIIDIFERIPLHYAANGVDVERVRSLLRSPDTNVNACDYQGFTALHHVLTNADIETDLEDIKSILQMLTDCKADPNIQDNRGMTPFQIAIFHNYYDVSLTKYILSSYSSLINFELANHAGENFLHCLFEKALYEETALKFLQDLLRGKFVPKLALRSMLNEKNAEGVTPFCLYLSNIFRDDTIVKRMLSLGAEVDTADYLGQTPIMFACWLDYNLARTLVRHKASTTAHDVFGRNTLYRAREKQTVALLLENGADLKTVDKFGRSVLSQNLLVSDPDCIEYLIKRGVDVNEPDINGSTPLHYAAYADRRDLVEILLKNKAKPKLKDQEGHTPYDVARLHICLNVLDFFKEHKMVKSTCSPVTYTYFAGVYEVIHPDDTEGRHLQKKLKITNDLYKASEKALTEQDILLSSHSEENQTVGKGVLTLMEKIVKRIGEIDERFISILIQSGSISEGTKTIEPNEFDFILCLTKFSELCIIVEESDAERSGLTKAKCKVVPPPRELSYFFDDTGHLITQNLRFAFTRLLRRVLREADIWVDSNLVMNGMTSGDSGEMEQPAVAFNATWFSCRHKHLQISIDTVPALRLKGWWPKHMQAVNIPLKTKAVKDEGCLLLAAVPTGGGADEIVEFYFRVSCFPAESYLLRNMRPEVKNAYTLAKILKSDGITPEVKFRGDGKTTKDKRVWPSSVIKSYMLKNCLFHVLSESQELLAGCRKTGSSQRDKMEFTVNLTIKIYQKLQHLSGKESNLPAYFLPNQNILNYFETYMEMYEYDSSDIDKRTKDLSAEINSICTVILGCLGVYQ